MGAVGEAITNAVKHGAPNRVTVFLDEDDGETLINAAAQRLGMGRSVVCTVHDDGVGFDPEHTAGGMGIVHSMRAPVEAVGGSVTIRSGPQTGTEVEFRLNGRARPQRRRS
ncbi:MAG: ATP-binding protein [Microthrixaceae bacterium]